MLFTRLLSICSCLAAFSTNALAGPTQSQAVPPGFVTTKGTQFQLDGNPFVGYAYLNAILTLIFATGVCRGQLIRTFDCAVHDIAANLK